MKFSEKLLRGRLKRRYKRFFAEVELQSGDKAGELITAHCPNTGSMKNCLVENGLCWVSESYNPKRKLAYTLEAVSARYGGMAGINTGRTNKLVREAFENQVITQLSDYPVIQSEVRFGEENSRLDFLLKIDRGSTSPSDQCFVEVKNMTLGCEGGLGFFPDSVTTRGSKHLRELLLAKQQGYRSILLFCAQHTGIERGSVAKDIDQDYASTLMDVCDQGVEVLCYGVSMSQSEFVIDRQLAFLYE